MRHFSNYEKKKLSWGGSIDSDQNHSSDVGRSESHLHDIFETAGGKQEAKQSSTVVVVLLIVFVFLVINEVIVCMVPLPRFREKASRLRR